MPTQTPETSRPFDKVYAVNGYAVWQAVSASLEHGNFHVMPSATVTAIPTADDAISSHEFLADAIAAANRYRAADARRTRVSL